MIRAVVTITNSTSDPAKPTMYGPVLIRLRHFSPPTLRPTQVYIKLPHQRIPYFGFVVPTVQPKTPMHLYLRFLPVKQPQSLVVTDKGTVDASDLGILKNPDCVLGKQAA